MVQCPNGHFYNSAEGRCPHCPNQGAAPAPPIQGQTMPLMQAKPQMPDTTGANPSPAKKQIPSEEGKTVSLYSKQKGIDPVVGWLVCTEGVNRGQDYRIHSEKNSIGRSTSNDINISGDQTISRENHATVIYDPKSKTFRLLAGGGRGLVYVNNQVVDYSLQLKNGDTIELGDTKLLLITLCGDNFTW